jgi:hypothetical protein
MSGYFTGMDENLVRTVLVWDALIIVIIGPVVLHAVLRQILRWIERPTIPRAKARRRIAR